MSERVEAISPDSLAALIAGRAVSLDLAHPTRVVIDGPVPGDCIVLAHAVANVVAGTGRQVLVVDAEDFLRPRSIRLETGADDPDAGYWRWYDHTALLREVLDRAPTGTVLPTLWDAHRDRATRQPPVPMAAAGVVVVAGPLLLRTELAGSVDLAVHLQVSERALQRRVDLADLTRVLGAWQQYLEWDRPEQTAELLVRFDRPSHPAVALRTSAR